jgi:hypothetical protein
MPAVLDYNRPLLPGTVRITHRQGGVTIKVAPDTAKRVLRTVLLPLFVLAMFALGALASLLARGGVAALVALVAFLGMGGWHLARTLRRANEPIVFRANPQCLEVHNPLDAHIDHVIAPRQIVGFQLRRDNPLLFRLEVLLDFGPMSPSHGNVPPLLLLASPNFETLDKIGRTLVTAMQLPEPSTGQMEWWSYAQTRPDATPSSAPPQPQPPPPRSSPDLAY